jgi:hypothetical protein
VATLILLLGCHWTAEGVGSCESMGDPIAKEDCRYDEITKLVGDDAAFTVAVDSLPEVSRDLVLYRLAVDDPSRAQRLCGMTRTTAMKDKCAKVLGRPHMSGPPPGASGPK